MGNTQENSDAIQFMHPLMSPWRNLEEVFWELLTQRIKRPLLLTTTQRVWQDEHCASKKSVQMPYTEQ
jgi:hypothetical protein